MDNNVLDKLTGKEQECHVYRWENGEYAEDELGDVMQFRLVYEGRLKAAGNSSTQVKNKHAIRKTFHHQLRELWGKHAGLRFLGSHKCKGEELVIPISNPWQRVDAQVGETAVDALGRRFDRCGFRFVPLVSKPFELVCGLDILFLRRENPGDLIMSGGDVDNRIKTLLDALRMPENCGEVDGTPEVDEVPFFCLLESDALVTQLSVTTDRLLAPLKTGQHENEVVLIIQVTVKAAAVSLSNFPLID